MEVQSNEEKFTEIRSCGIFFCDYTECEGMSLASSLLLDQLGVNNIFCGAEAHALNAVYLDGKWYRWDMTLFSWDEPEDLTPERVFCDVNNEMWISGSPQFKLYRYSFLRQYCEVTNENISNLEQYSNF